MFLANNQFLGNVEDWVLRFAAQPRFAFVALKLLKQKQRETKPGHHHIDEQNGWGSTMPGRS